MKLGARLTLAVLFIAFAAGIVLVLLPVASAAPASTDCGSVALHTAAQTRRASCDVALRRRTSLVLQIAIAGLALGIVDTAVAFTARRRRERRSEALTDARI